MTEYKFTCESQTDFTKAIMALQTEKEKKKKEAKLELSNSILSKLDSLISEIEVVLTKRKLILEMDIIDRMEFFVSSDGVCSDIREFEISKVSCKNHKLSRDQQFALKEQLPDVLHSFYEAELEEDKLATQMDHKLQVFLKKNKISGEQFEIYLTQYRC